MKIKLLIFFALLSLGAGAQVVIDSYPESNQDATVSNRTGSVIMRGQSFTCTNAIALYSVKWYIAKFGSPTGNIRATIWAHSGDYGTSSVPTGDSIAVSENIDISTLSTSLQLKEFIFTGVNKINLSGSTYYVVGMYYDGGDASNYLVIGYDNSSAVHSGNRSYNYSTPGLPDWLPSANDMIFYVYGTQIKKIGGVTDANTKKVGSVADASIKKISGKTK